MRLGSTRLDVSRNNVYVRLLGTIKSFSGKRSINCTRARVIEDKNEILYHFAECAYVSMTLLKGPVSRALASRLIELSN